MEPSDTRTNIARRNIRLAVALRETNFSEVSRKAGMSRNGVSQFLKGNTTLSYSNMLAVCDVLRIPIGLVHRPDAITEQRLRLYRALEEMPEHLVLRALDLTKSIQDGQ